MTSKDQPKYKNLGFLVKAILSKVSVERGFSINKRMLMTSARSSLSIIAITGLRIKDTVNGRAINACITKEIIQFYKEKLIYM